MSKKFLIQREHKRKKFEEKFRLIRQSLKKKSKASSLSQREIREIQRKLQFLLRNSAPTRLHRRCLVTGRFRTNYREILTHFTIHILFQKKGHIQECITVWISLH